MPVHVDLFDVDCVTPVRRITQSWSRTWSTELREVGAGQLVCQVGTADADELTHRRLVKFIDADTDEVLAAWVIRNTTQRFLDANGHHGQTLVAKGVDVLAFLGEAQVYPTLGLGRNAGPDRPFTWAGGSLSRLVGWIAPWVIKDIDTEDADPPYVDAPAGIPRGYGAKWIAAREPVTGTSEIPPQRVGDEFAFAEFEVDAQTDAAVFWSADDGLEIWIDDRRWSQETEAFLWMETKTFALVLDAGVHHIAVKLTNIERDSVETNGAGFILSIHQMLNGGSEVGDLILTTNDSDWVVAEEPDPAPTMTPGEILDLLLTEAQDRGCFPWLSWTFDGELDSLGEPWGTRVDITARVNRPILAVLEELIEVAVDARIDPDTLELIMVNRGTLGSVGSVVLSPATNVAGQSVDGEGPIANVALVYHGTGQFLEVEHAPSVAKYGRIEGGAEIGSADSADQVQRVLDEWFSENAVSEHDLSIEIEAVPGAVPYLDFLVGDTVTVPWTVYLELVGGGYLELVGGGYLELVEGSISLLVERIEVSEVDPSQDGRVGGSQRYVVAGSHREVLDEES